MNIYDKKDLAEAIKAETDTLQKYQVSPLGWLPVVAVGQVSENQWAVGILYQPSGVQVGDTFMPPHLEDLIEGMFKVEAVRKYSFYF